MQGNNDFFPLFLVRACVCVTLLSCVWQSRMQMNLAGGGVLFSSERRAPSVAQTHRPCQSVSICPGNTFTLPGRWSRPGPTVQSTQTLLCLVFINVCVYLRERERETAASEYLYIMGFFQTVCPPYWSKVHLSPCWNTLYRSESLLTTLTVAMKLLC